MKGSTIQFKEIFYSLADSALCNPGHVLILKAPFGAGKSQILGDLGNYCTQAGIDYLHLDLSSRSIEQIAAEIRSEDLPKAQSAINNHTSDTTHAFFDLPLFSLPTDIRHEKPSNSDTLYQFAQHVNSNYQSRIYVLLIDNDSSIPNLLTKLYKMLLGHLNANILVVIASRTSFALLSTETAFDTTIFELLPLTAEESKRYLDENGISAPDLQVAIAEFTGGNPYLLQMSASLYQSGLHDSRALAVAVAHEGIKKALMEFSREFEKEIVRLCSVGRWINLEIMRRLTNSGRISQTYESLTRSSIFDELDGGLRLDPLLRKLFVCVWQSESPKRFQELNERILRYYRELANQFEDQGSHRFIVEYIFHEYQTNETAGIEAAVDAFYAAAYTGYPDLCELIVSQIEDLSFRREDKESWLHLFSASLHHFSFDWHGSIEVLNNALGTELRVPRVRACLLAQLAESLRMTGNWSEAEKRSDEALRIFKSSGQSNEGFYACLTHINSLIHQHLWDRAESQLQTMRSLLDDTTFLVPEVLYLFASANLFRSQGKWDLAHDALSTASEICGNSSYPYFAADISLGYGKLYRNRQEWYVAVDYFEQCIEQSRSLGNTLLLAQALHSLGGIQLRLGQFDSAERFFSESMRAKESINDSYGLAKGYNSLAHVFRMQGDYMAALQNYNIAYELFQKVENLHKSSRVLCRIGMTLAETGNTVKATEYLKHSLSVRYSLVDYQGIAESHLELGKVLEQNGDAEQAIREYRRSVDFADDSHASSRLLSPLVQLASRAFASNQVTEGSNYILKAREVARKSQQYTLLSQLLRDRAAFELDDGHNKVGLMLLTEAVYMSSFAGDKVARESMHVLWDAINIASKPGPNTTVEDYCRRSLQYWNQHCPNKPPQPGIWSLLTSTAARDAVLQPDMAHVYFKSVL